MPDLIGALRSYNRKERFILLTQVTAGEGEMPFSRRFRERLTDALEGVEVPESPDFLAMDYHLNWLGAALQESHGHHRASPLENRSAEGPKGPRHIFEPNQEDADLVVAWHDGDRTHLVLVEAKAYTGYSLPQFHSKFARLRAIFERDDSPIYPDVELHFVVAGFSPLKKSGALEGWPSWALNSAGAEQFVQLDRPVHEVTSVGRTVDGKPNRAGDYHVTVVRAAVDAGS